MVHLLKINLSVRHTAHSTWKVSDSWCGTSSSSLGVDWVVGTGDSEEDVAHVWRELED